MRILLCAATSFEIRPFLTRLPLAGKVNEQLAGYRYKDALVDVLIPGIGMVATAYHLGRQLAMVPYDLAVNAGIAGTFNPSLPLGSVVNVVEDCVPELGAEDGDLFLSAFDLGLADPDTIPYEDGRLINREAVTGRLSKLGTVERLPKVKGLTSNTVRGNHESIARIRKMATADIESMEGAAFFYGCLSAGIPCLQLRAVSNHVEERNKADWKLDLSLKNLNRTLTDLLVDIYKPFP
jgi:futalosine hydrolase